VNVRQAAEQLEVSPSLVYALCARGKLGHHRVGLGRGAIRITDDDVRAYRDATRVEARADRPAVRAPARAPAPRRRTLKYF
jgi:excisionase family DNA binding protein